MSIIQIYTHWPVFCFKPFKEMVCHRAMLTRNMAGQMCLYRLFFKAIKKRNTFFELKYARILCTDKISFPFINDA